MTKDFAKYWRSGNLISTGAEMVSAGHFAAMERPELSSLQFSLHGRFKTKSRRNVCCHEKQGSENCAGTKRTPVIAGCYFLMADIEGNIWEVACNLLIPLDANGNVITQAY